MKVSHENRLSFIALLLLSSLLIPIAHADDWPQWRGLNRDGVWHETGIIESFSGPTIERPSVRLRGDQGIRRGAGSALHRDGSCGTAT